MGQVRTAVAAVEKDLGKTFGGSTNPLLVSVRSGAKFSMPGMMDTILNLGLNPETLQGVINESGSERFAYDAYRRFIMMFSAVVLGLEKETFEHAFDAKKKSRGIKLDTDLTAQDLKEISNEFLAIVQKETGASFPTDPWKQLELAIEAVFKSWNNDRAIIYRRTERIPDEIGTAVNVQAMVFGNLGDDCGTGVAFTRDPSTGENYLYGEYLMNAQGEDVVAGVRTPVPISELEKQNRSANSKSRTRPSTTSLWPFATAWKVTTRTCRTWSSRSKRVGTWSSRSKRVVCSCSSAAPVSAPAPPPCASPWKW